MSDKVFSIIRQSVDIDGKCLYKARIDANSKILNGHFPSMPVVPGVCTISMIKSCVADALSFERVRFELIKECKFLGAIIPSHHSLVDVIITLKRGDECVDVIALVEREGVKLMKLRATAIF